MSNVDDNVIREFLVESYENLDRLDRELVNLEDDPSDRETLASVFRTIHTIKGTCGFLGFSKLESVTHAGENLLGRLRDGDLQLNAEITSALLAMVDAVREILISIESTQQEGEGDYSVLVVTLNRLYASGRVEVPTQPEPAEAANDRSPQEEQIPEEEVHKIGDILVQTGKVKPEDIAGAIEEQRQGDPRRVGEILVEKGVLPPKEVVHALNAQSDARVLTAAETSIRVPVELLDKLMNLVGELVLVRNQILQFSLTENDRSFNSASQRLNLITTELQERVMKTRMQPIGNVWDRFPRLVRDLALECNKKVRIEMEGKDTELDKTIIEAIKDPLTHLVRNAVDHGIESQEARAAAGKPSEGRIFLSAFHEGGQVNIEISDDGTGIDPWQMKQKALERGLISSEEAARLSEREQLNLLFLPGFSTAKQVTSVSGRGVGMDVVKTNIEKIGGTVDIQSKPGEGTTVRMKIPLTLAIIPALIVTSGEDRYAIPQVNLLELVRLEGEQAKKGVELVHGAPVYRLRGNLLPLVYLRQVLGLENEESDSAKGDSVNIVVLQADDRQFGLVVEGIHDTEEIVVKPLGKHLKGIACYAGATIMGDGRVALILDVLGLAQHARVISKSRERILMEETKEVKAPVGNQQTMLIFEVGQEGRMAMPLALVARLEEFAQDKVERSRTQEVVQYRGEIMPLIRLTSVLGYAESEAVSDGHLLQVVVYSRHGHSVGVVVKRILDIVQENITVQRDVQAHGLLGSAVIQGRITDLLDIEDVVRRANPEFFPAPVETGANA